MSIHASLTPPIGVDISAELALDCLRRLAGTRDTGAREPADEALRALASVASREAAWRAFGLLWEMAAGAPEEFVWHPVGARRSSGDEGVLLALALRRLDRANFRTPAPAPEAFCAEAGRACALAVAEPACAPASCPFEHASRRSGAGSS